MKVKELIELLSKYDLDFDVVVSWNHGDYGLEPLMEVDSIEVGPRNEMLCYSKTPNAVCLWPH
jgi:hypothetical protein